MSFPTFAQGLTLVLYKLDGLLQELYTKFCGMASIRSSIKKLHDDKKYERADRGLDKNHRLPFLLQIENTPEYFGAPPHFVTWTEVL